MGKLMYLSYEYMLSLAKQNSKTEVKIEYCPSLHFTYWNYIAKMQNYYINNMTDLVTVK